MVRLLIRIDELELHGGCSFDDRDSLARATQEVLRHLCAQRGLPRFPGEGRRAVAYPGVTVTTSRESAERPGRMLALAIYQTLTSKATTT